LAENRLTTLVGEPTRTKNHYNNPTEIIGFKLDILGKRVNFRIGVGKGRARLADNVPLARTLCSKITDVVLKKTHSDGGHIPCRKGCSACCSHCLVPLSVPEALRFKEEIDAAPAYRRESVWGACLRAAQLILSQKLPKLFLHQTEISPARPVDLNLVSNWYTNLNLACPLSQQRCVFHL